MSASVYRTASLVNHVEQLIARGVALLPGRCTYCRALLALPFRDAAAIIAAAREVEPTSDDVYGRHP